MGSSELLAISVPLSGTSSDEESEALPDNRVYFTKASARNQAFHPPIAKIMLWIRLVN